MSDPTPLPRVRITAQGALERDSGPTPDAIDPRSLFVRSLMRGQLRLALYCAAGFVGLLLLFLTGLNIFPELEQRTLLGVPIAWLLLGFGVYPLIITTAVIFARSARRNERSYRELLQSESASE